jgi:hypothetical protein
VGAYLHSGEDICLFIFIHFLCIAINFRLFLLFYLKSASQDPKMDSAYVEISTYSSEKKNWFGAILDEHLAKLYLVAQF